MIAPTYGCLKRPPQIPKLKGTEMTTPNQTDKRETPELFIQPAENGGFTVKASIPSDYSIERVLMSAYSCGADLIEDMPELLGLDGITAAAYTEDESIGLNIFDDEGWDYPDDDLTMLDEDAEAMFRSVVERRRAELDEREAKLEARKGDLDRRTDALSKCERRVYKNAAELSKREHTLDMREGNVSRREEAMNMRELGVNPQAIGFSSYGPVQSSSAAEIPVEQDVTDIRFQSKRGLDGAI